ncbi:MAG: fluoride efflux transporter CrcB [Thermomicrobiales bacterium]|nr:fluoride efflux transporter CrcB [Thermomicrobiales bacterium]
MDYLWIATGAVAGANLRYIIGMWASNRFGVAFPYGTFAINITGALVIGFLLTLLTKIVIADPRWRLLLIVGFLGAYTTFRTYAFEAIALVERGDAVRSAVYVVGSNAIGLGACLGGIALARIVGAR